MCNCVLESHLTIKNNLQSEIEDELPINIQSDIEGDLENTLSEYDLNLDDPNFVEPEEQIKISHIKDQGIKTQLKIYMTQSSPTANLMWEAVISSTPKSL